MFDQTSSFEPAKPLQQHVNFVAAVNAAGGCASTLPPFDSVVLHRRIMGVPVAMMPRFDPTDASLDHMRHHLKAAGLARHMILISPEKPVPDMASLGAIPIMTPATVAELDLTANAQVRQARMHKKWRNRLNKGRSAGLRISEAPLPTDRPHRLLTQDEAQSKARGYKNWPTGLTLAYAATNPGHAMLFTASQNRTRVAEILILIHGSVATYHIGHISPAGKTLCAHNVLMDHAAQWLTERGIQRLDLGVINTDAAAGLARFKLGMGATAKRLGGTWGWWPPLGRSLGGLARLDGGKMGP